ncbi:MAG TPA: hypothetical protein DD811_14365, partial [Syntrophomonas sp.]|nr:hypothetical protein [Syntrophomonas sp.]
MSQAINNWQKAVEFHGHECPGLAIGVRAVPSKARIFASQICEVCQEAIPENKVRMQDGKKVC